MPIIDKIKIIPAVNDKEISPKNNNHVPKKENKEIKFGIYISSTLTIGALTDCAEIPPFSGRGISSTGMMTLT